MRQIQKIVLIFKLQSSDELDISEMEPITQPNVSLTWLVSSAVEKCNYYLN